MGSEIEVTVRDQSVIFWNDVEAQTVAEAILDEVCHTQYKNGEKLPRLGDKVTIKKNAPEDWDDSYWPAGQVGMVIDAYEYGDTGKLHYEVAFDDSDVDVLNEADYFFAEDFTVIPQDEGTKL